MNNLIKIREILPLTLAVRRGRANHTNMGAQFMAQSPSTWEFVRAQNIPNFGQNVIVYHHTPGVPGFETDAGIEIEVGVWVKEPFAAADPIFCSATPGGKAVVATHTGSYDRLGETHDAISTWCRENGHALTGTVWEIYGHWKENPDEMTTEIFYQLA